jgi:protoporphyrin/coproporphyrin ferrochelatase
VTQIETPSMVTMPRYQPEPPYTHGTTAKTGILLVNLGTPDEPTARAVRRYLQQFLSDPRVIEIPQALWWPILNGVILNVRPAKSAVKYAAIWTSEGSPLRVHTERQAALLRGYLGERGIGPFALEYAMRYGSPSIAASVAKLKAQFCDRILLFPLYPQYACSTTASSQDEFFRALRSYRSTPAVRTIRDYHDHPSYIAALAQNVLAYWSSNGRPDTLVLSFHGVPRRTLSEGDPYHCECQKTGRLLGEALGLAQDAYSVAFQSRFGRAEWLRPYTAATLETLARQGKGRVDVMCPGFPADCIETLEEIAIEGKSAFMQAGGREFHYIPCLNERAEWISAMADIALENLQGWVLPATGLTHSRQETELSRARALALGATN